MEGAGYVAQEHSPGEGRFARRRRANYAGGRQHQHKVRVSPEEHGRLLTLALEQGVTIPRLLVESALSIGQGETPTQRREAMAELFGLHRLLAAISNNVNQIARVANATGELREELEATLRKSREVASRIDDAIDGLALQ